MIIAFDLETTGLDKHKDEIIEIALIKFDEKNFETIETYSSLINPWIKIPSVISNITNIFDSDVLNAPDFKLIRSSVKEFIWDLPVLWHNTYFDRDFLIENWIDISNNIVLDTFFLANLLCFKEKSLNLEMLCKSFNISFTWAHRALNDVKVTIRLFEKLVKKFNKLSKTNKEILKYIFLLSEDKNIDYLNYYLFDENIKNLSSEEFEKKILKKAWLYNEMNELYVDKDLYNIDISEIYLNIWNLEIRKNQLDMLKVVFDTFKWSQKAAIEAPTGLWKTFAYLIPWIIYSIAKWEKIYISTKTKALQDQIYFKDLKFLEDNIWIKFNYSKLKGKKNYISIKWLFDEIYLDKLNYKKVNFLSKIILWLDDTIYGELDELNYYWQEFLYLRYINADSSLILSESNSYLHYEYLFKARQKILTSNIVIINHNLLFSDLKTDNYLFWKINNLIIDEWHNIEDSVTESVKQSINEKIINDLLNYISNIFIKKDIKQVKFLNLKNNLLKNLSFLLDYSYSYLSSKISSEDKYKLILIKNDYFDDINFIELWKNIELDFIDIITLLSTINEYDFTKEMGVFNKYLEIIKNILDKDKDKLYIKIISFNDNNWVSLEYTLLNPWEYLKTNLWDKINSILLTSATLKIWDSFNYFEKLLFLEDFNFYSYDTEFDYKNQATLFIPKDLWSIKNNNNLIINFLKRFYDIVEWNTLTLFTSFYMIKNIYTELNIELRKKWITLFAQWITWSKTKLIDFFNENPDKSILLWTNIFWEWIDLPWNNLKYLIIHKIPFWIPTDPIFQARSKFFKDPFKDYSIPKSIIKLKQWFWRLIRWKNDKWIIILLDDRIINTSWWKEFYNSFPKDINIKIWESDNLLKALQKYINK